MTTVELQEFIDKGFVPKEDTTIESRHEIILMDIQMWFRNVHKIDVESYLSEYVTDEPTLIRSYKWRIIRVNELVDYSNDEFNTYDKALSAGLIKTLNKI